MMNEHIKKLDKIEKHSARFQAKNADIFPGGIAGPVDPVMAALLDSIFIEVEKERSKMKLNNGIVQSVEYKLIEDTKK